MKKLISVILALAALLALAVPAGASFPDIADAQTQEEVAVLQMMGVINGTSANTFSPNGALTRAQFCKMAVVLLGRAEEEPLYRVRTIFPDVRAGHWARGYINLAVSIDIGAGEDGKGGTKLIRGMGNGTFQPDRNITYAEAVTILLRMLGYSDLDAGMSWPKGYLELAAKIELTAGMNLSADQALTRAQAAHLFAKMLTTPQKSGGAYYNTLGNATADVVLTDGNAAADDGTLGAMKTSGGKTYKTVSGIVPAGLVGRRGTLITNEAGLAVVFIPVGEQKTIVVGKANADGENVQASWVVDREGQRYQIPPATPAYTANETSTYGEIWMDLRSGDRLTIFYSAAGRVEGVYKSTAAAETAMVARTVGAGNPFASLLGGAVSYTVYRDGSPASVGDICAYDVGVYDAASRVLSVSSAKLTGRYENVWPNPQSPAKVTVLGVELPVMDMAIEEVAKLKLGDNVTLFLTHDGQVAGAAASSVVRTENIGVLEELSGEAVKVTLINGVKLEGNTASTGLHAGELVRVSSGTGQKLTLSRVSGSGVSGALDVAGRRVGTTALSGGCRLFEKVGASAMREIDLTDLTVASVPGSQITYGHKDSAGRIDLLILNNATGDVYTYGMLKNGEPVSAGEDLYNHTILVTNGDNPGGTAPVISNMAIPRDGMGGVAVTADGQDAAGVVTLTQEKGIRRSAFTTRDGQTYVRLSSQEMRVSEQVQCYNAVTKTWFASLADARAFSDNLTVWYDRPVQEGGKVRVVVAN